MSLIESVPVRDPIWVGEKVTLIAQLFPAAKVLPQVLVCVKFALVVMLLMSSVALPALLSVAFFAALDASTTTVPKERPVGDTVMPLTCGSTVRLTYAVRVKLPDTPVIVTVAVPKVAEPVAVKVSVLGVVAGLGLNMAVTPVGRPEADSRTLPSKPLYGVTVIVLEPLPP